MGFLEPPNRRHTACLSRRSHGKSIGPSPDMSQFSYACVSDFMGLPLVAARHHVEREAAHYSHIDPDVVTNGAERSVSDQPRAALCASITDLRVASSNGLRLGSRRSRSAFKVWRGQWPGSGTR